MAARLVTLVGPGGVGKTRLALRSATDLWRGIADGAWLVELAGLQYAELVTKAVMISLGLRESGGPPRVRSGPRQADQVARRSSGAGGWRHRRPPQPGDRRQPARR
jgi:predicted ATPase